MISPIPMLVLVRLAVVVEWINDGDVSLHGYQNQVKQTHVRDHLHQRCESRNDNVEAARIVEDVNDEKKGIVPERYDGGYDVGQQHACQDEVGFGPESGSLPDRS